MPSYPPNMIFELRERKGWTQKELAEKIGTTPQTVGRWEMRTRPISSTWVFRLATAFSCTPDKIFALEPSSSDRPFLRKEIQLAVKISTILDSEFDGVTLEDKMFIIDEFLKEVSENKPEKELHSNVIQFTRGYLKRAS